MSTLREKLKGKEYRDAFVKAHIETGVPFQVRAIREQRRMSQERLATLLGTSQPGVARIESPDRRLDLKTLMRVASAFDVALVVRFVPFGELAGWVENLSAEALRVPSFAEEQESTGKAEVENVSKVQTFGGASIVTMGVAKLHVIGTPGHATKRFLAAQPSHTGTNTGVAVRRIAGHA